MLLVLRRNTLMATEAIITVATRTSVGRSRAPLSGIKESSTMNLNAILIVTITPTNATTTTMTYIKRTTIATQHHPTEVKTIIHPENITWVYSVCLVALRSIPAKVEGLDIIVRIMRISMGTI
jgi:hypothetical protein